MAGRIIVGIDGSPASADALKWALRQAAASGSTVVAVCAWHYSIIPGGLAPMVGVDMEANARDILRRIIDQTTGPGESVLSRTVPGHPVQVLVDESEEADLLVVGSRGHGGFAGMPLGSVSSQVPGFAHCPTVIVPRSPDPDLMLAAPTA